MCLGVRMEDYIANPLNRVTRLTRSMTSISGLDPCKR
jgi:hypothetical protein